MIEQMGQMERELTWVRAEVGRQQDYARAAFADQDHIQYCQDQLLVSWSTLCKRTQLLEPCLQHKVMLCVQLRP